MSIKTHTRLTHLTQAHRLNTEDRWWCVCIHTQYTPDPDARERTRRSRSPSCDLYLHGSISGMHFNYLRPLTRHEKHLQRQHSCKSEMFSVPKLSSHDSREHAQNSTHTPTQSTHTAELHEVLLQTQAYLWHGWARTSFSFPLLS